MGYAYGGVCYETVEAAAAGVLGTFGIQNGTTLASYDGTTTGAAGELLHFTATGRQYVAGTYGGGGYEENTFSVQVITPACEEGDFTNSPFVLSNDQGAQIGLAVLTVWALAWVFRAIARGFFNWQEKEE